MTKLATIIILLLCLFNTSHAIQVSGDVWGTWTADNNPYEVIDDLRVPQCSTLIIEPGCYIDFQGCYAFIIDTSACLMAIGTSSDSIVFTASDTVSRWLGINFFNADSNCIINHCIIEWGKSDIEGDDYVMGGGVACHITDMQITNCLFRKNESMWDGGGLYCRYSDITISDNIFIENRTIFCGAAICCYSSEVLIYSNIIKDNIAYNPLGGENGGGIFCSTSDVIIRGNIISNNISGTLGGGVYIRNSTLLVESNIVCNNLAYTYGGGIMANFGVGGEIIEYYYNNLIYGNEGVISDGGLMAKNAVLENNTICNNRTNWMGGGLSCSSGLVEDPLFNNIIRGNIASEGPQIFIHGSIDSITFIYNNIEDGWPGEGNIDADPLFCEPDTGNFYLAENSPCVGTGFEGANMGAYGIGCDPVGILEHFSYLPDDFKLFQNHPNPFNARTTIRYNLNIPTDVVIDIYDILGRKVETLISIKQPAGEHQVIWDAMDKSSGMYFYKLQAGNYSEAKKMLLLK